jgi:glycerol-3-phosphate acyltransferase PlsX
MGSPGNKVRVCVDAMGGDFAPQRIVEGSVAAAEAFADRIEVLLVGNQEAIQAELETLKLSEDHLRIVHAPEAIGMDERGAKAVRRKRNSSLAVAARIMQSGDADALISAGNTAAVVSTALVGLGRIPGVLRPAIASVIPSRGGRCVVLDVGATTECKPEYLVHFAIMGTIYAETTLGIATPRVGLLNIGEEPGKGNELTRAAYHMLADAPIDFIGNVEGRDVVRGTADVVVCDGFIGNVVLKFGESFVEFLAHLLRDQIRRDPLGKIGAVLVRPSMRRMFKSFDYAEYGGAPLLGVKGGCIICHGSSSVRAIRNAIRVAAEFVAVDLNGKITERLQKGQAHG